MASVEDFTYVDAPPQVVYRLIADLAQQARYFPSGLRYMRALTPTTDTVGARVEIMLQLFGPIWRTYVMQLHAVERGRAAIIGTPDAATYMVRWRLEPEPPGTLTNVAVDYQGGGLLAWRMQTVLARVYRRLLARLKELAEADNPTANRR